MSGDALDDGSPYSFGVARSGARRVDYHSRSRSWGTMSLSIEVPSSPRMFQLRIRVPERLWIAAPWSSRTVTPLRASRSTVPVSMDPTAD